MAVAYDPGDPAIRRDPYPAYCELRRSAPVALIPSTGFYAVSRQRDVREVLRDTATYSSRAMRFTRTNGRPDPAGLSSQNLSAEGAARLAAALPFPVQDLVSARSVIYADPPVHEPLRGIVNRG